MVGCSAEGVVLKFPCQQPEISRRMRGQLRVRGISELYLTSKSILRVLAAAADKEKSR